MTGIEILLLVIGVVFYIASFFITEKLGPSELNKIGELSQEEIKGTINRELATAVGEVGNRVEEKIEDILLKSERSIEKECNEKIMAISEFSDTVVESMNKTHNEIMFLYSMLNDKHAELTKLSAKLQEQAAELEKRDEKITMHLAQSIPVPAPVPVNEIKPEPKTEAEESPVFREGLDAEVLSGEDFVDMEETNHNAEILALYKEGKSSIDIARDLALGLGEVQLVIGLYEGKKKK